MSTIQGMYVHILQFHYQNKYLKTFYMQYGEYLIIVFSAMVHHDISMTSVWHQPLIVHPISLFYYVLGWEKEFDKIYQFIPIYEFIKSNVAVQLKGSIPLTFKIKIIHSLISEYLTKQIKVINNGITKQIILLK